MSIDAECFHAILICMFPFSYLQYIGITSIELRSAVLTARWTVVAFYEWRNRKQKYEMRSKHDITSNDRWSYRMQRVIYNRTTIIRLRKLMTCTTQLVIVVMYCIINCLLSFIQCFRFRYQLEITIFNHTPDYKLLAYQLNSFSKLNFPLGRTCFWTVDGCASAAETVTNAID